MKSNKNRLAPEEMLAFKIDEAVVVYRLSRSTIYKMISAGQLRTVKVGKCRLIPRDALDALLRQNAPV